MARMRRRLALPVGIAGLAAATFAFGALVLPQLATDPPWAAALPVSPAALTSAGEPRAGETWPWRAAGADARTYSASRKAPARTG